MNERIRELAKQAGYTPLPEDLQEVFLQKFAELLYKDIITVVAAHALSHESAMNVFLSLKRIYEEESQ